jgi:hypothetical protein
VRRISRSRRWDSRSVSTDAHPTIPLPARAAGGGPHMPQLLHLLIVDRDRRRALVQRHGGRWLLPIAACGERARGPSIVARWLADHAIDGAVVGQWRGRLSYDARACDWLLIVAASRGQAAPATLVWTPVDELRSSPAMVEYQLWALMGLSAGDLSVPGPFGRLSWIDDVVRWASERAAVDLTRRTVCYRASPYEVVVRLQGEVGRFYFKGLAAAAATDAMAMHAASVAAPGSFTPTIALETTPDGTVWWLMGECAGQTLVSTMSSSHVVRVAADVCRLQQKLLDTRPVSRLDLGSLLSGAHELLQPCDAGVQSRVAVAFDYVSGLRTGWTPLDLDPTNVLVSASGIRYIDLEPRIAAMPLSASIFAHRLCRRLGIGLESDLIAAVRRAYEQASGESVIWKQVDIAAASVEVLLGFDRLKRNVERGDVSGPSGALTGHARQLLAAAAGASLEAVEERA